jgi:hypothetical protein
MTTITVSDDSRRSRTTPLLAALAVAGLLGVAAFTGVALEHQHSGTTTDPPVVVYPGSAVFDNVPTVQDPPFVPYPGAAVFDNQPAAQWWTSRDDRQRPAGTPPPVTDRAPRDQQGQ